MSTTDELVYEVGVDWDKIGFGNFTESMNRAIESLNKLSEASVLAANAAAGETKDDLDDVEKEAKKKSKNISKYISEAAESNRSSFGGICCNLSSRQKLRGIIRCSSKDF